MGTLEAFGLVVLGLFLFVICSGYLLDLLELRRLRKEKRGWTIST